ncbi:uncharacterized protein LOC134260691 [Saccostrea cucullata]|uniref:uncharacterized protein LOC134260691 n=1 Tax=Saccostrea cuccullata TaxID=36930 RepID=UPI002ED37D9C
MDKLQRHYEQTIERLTEIKMRHEQTLRENLTKNNQQGNSIILKFNTARKELVKHMELMEKNACFMSDYNLIANNRELKRIMTDLDFKVENCEYSARYMRGEINDDVLESIIGHTLKLNCINATETNSFQPGNNAVFILEAISEDCCYIRSMTSKIRKVNIAGNEKYESGINAKDVCVKADDCIYYTDYKNKCISSLSPYGYLSTIVSTKPLTPGEICLSLDGGLLVTLTDELSDTFELQPCRRRLVRHLKMNGDLIHDYEYQEDGRTRIFVQPTSIAQNGNRDICVVNQSGDKTGDLVLLSFSGRTKSVYRGQNMSRYFKDK